MIDLVSLILKAGDGGNGRISFRREKYAPKGGPDGGYGGDGGSVIVVGSKHFNTLKHYAGKTELTARPGGKGMSRKKTGPKGENIVLEVPIGTVIWLDSENETSVERREKYTVFHSITRREADFEVYEVEKETESIPPREISEIKPLAERVKLAEILEEGREIVLCQGGFGGRGSIAFKSSTNTTPLIAEYGTFGEQKKVTFELKLLADIGLVGFPNAGKSTLLSKLTRANPKTADYPFTTIEPNLGVLNLPGGRDLIMADIPGLIEGASEGRGLGLDFLRHIENSQQLLFVLFLEEEVVSNESLSDKEKAELVWQQYQTLRGELKDYQPTMLKKPTLISLNKTDIYSAELIKKIVSKFKTKKEIIHPFSGIAGKGLEDLLKKITDLFHQAEHLH